jgi:hypothetical protein
MACEECDRARNGPGYRRYDLKCLWCGARYARSVRTSTDLKFPAQVSGQEMTRRQWFDHVLKTWTDFGHDQARLEELARGATLPLEPVGGRRADDANSAQDGQRGKRARAVAGKAPAHQGGTRGDRVAAEIKAPAAAAGGGDDDQGRADEWAR